MPKPVGQETEDHPVDHASADKVPASKSRREALKSLAYAASVAPAMVVLLNGSADAQGWNGKGNGPGNGNGGPNCDNPGLHLGFNRNGHSAC
ncbi:MAG: hypothetical protein RLZ98_78 [Pseudomonadota bacterium]|jgi:hypothetical protein